MVNRIVIDFLADIYTLLLLVCLISANLIKHLENPGMALIRRQGGWSLLVKWRRVWIDPGDMVGCFFVSYSFIVINGGGSGGLVLLVRTVACKVPYCSAVKGGIACLSFDICRIASEASSSSTPSSSSSAVSRLGLPYVHGDWLIIHGAWGIGGVELWLIHIPISPGGIPLIASIEESPPWSLSLLPVLEA